MRNSLKFPDALKVPLRSKLFKCISVVILGFAAFSLDEAVINRTPPTQARWKVSLNDFGFVLKSEPENCDGDQASEAN